MQLMRFAWKTKIITKGGTTRFSPKQPGKKSDLLQNIIYPPKGRKKNKEKRKILEQAASWGKSRVVYLPLSTLLIQLLKKFKMQTLLQ